VARRLALVMAIGLCALLPAAVAAGDPDPRTPREIDHGLDVVTGTSPAGIDWHVGGVREQKDVDFEFYFDPPGYSDAGYFTAVPLPVPKRFVFSASSGSDLSPRPEGDLSGVASTRVHSMRVEMSDGSRVDIELLEPRKPLQRKHAWARHLLFFDTFFPEGPHPEVVTAFDRKGNVLLRADGRGGSFP
jgi:hypothetical protein